MVRVAPTGTPDAMAWATTFTLAHLRIPRIEMMAYDDLDEAYHLLVKMVIDKALTALAATTWPVHDEPQGALL